MVDLTIQAARFAVVAALSIPVALLPAIAIAQTAEEDSVQNRSRPDFDAIGIELDELLGVIGLVSEKTIEQKSSPLSSFVVKPSFGVTGVYESNIFLTENNAVGDKRVEYQPELLNAPEASRFKYRIASANDVMRLIPAKTA